ncbi:hypothetical protein GALL_224200 [mine drainage metagenome]|uniref:Uncharacterized protein n=1 Tax=mine drainage metagenome TaxID=410659 RepID=A0A1J5RTZ3_9ZZZZ
MEDEFDRAGDEYIHKQPAGLKALRSCLPNDAPPRPGPTAALAYEGHRLALVQASNLLVIKLNSKMSGLPIKEREDADLVIARIHAV